MQRTIDIGGGSEAVRMFGPQDVHLKRLRDAFSLNLSARGGRVRLDGDEDEVGRCEAILTAMHEHVAGGGTVGVEMVDRLINVQQSEHAVQGDRAARELQPWPGVSPRTKGQASYVHAMLTNEVVFCIGPAGTGKTYLGAAMALNFLKAGKVNRIILCRPAVEAGESLGFLPGDMYAKVNPYLRPLYDALHDLMDVRRVQRHIENDVIEILPLAFVRGRTLDKAFIILDEAQNCTVSQMKTFLTRLGPQARLLVTGDITQNDLEPGQKSGLADALERLTQVQGIEFVRLTKQDIVRHPIVGRILAAYERELPATVGSEDRYNAQ